MSKSLTSNDPTPSAALQSSAPLLPQAEIPRGMEVIGPAGNGTFCEVWQVRDGQTGTLWALKRLKPEWRDNATTRRLLSNEARVARAVCSRHVVAAGQLENSTSEFSILLEWLDGTTLEQRLKDEPMLPAATAVWIARQCAQGLLALERAGYTHGDIKPANVFVTSSGNVKLVDLGFACPTGSHQPGSTHRVLAGTAEFMAPESLSRQPSNPVLKDIYSLGVTLFRMLTGELPFAAQTTAEVLQLQRTARPPRLRQKCPHATRELANVVEQMLAKHPIRRPGNLHRLVRTLIDFELALFPQRAAG